MTLVRVYCGLASADLTATHRDSTADRWLTVAVVDDAGRLLDIRDVSDDATGYSELATLMAERCAGVNVSIAADHDDHVVTHLLGAVGRSMAYVDDDSVDDYAERFADDGSAEEIQASPTERRAVGLARALQSGMLAASPQPTPRDLLGLKPVLAAHAAVVAGRQGAASTLREVLRELYPAALRAFSDPADTLPLAILDALPEPGLLASGQSDPGRESTIAADLAADEVADAATVNEAITALRVAASETPRRYPVTRSLSAAVADTVRQSVASVRSCDAAAEALIGVLTDRLTGRSATPQRSFNGGLAGPRLGALRPADAPATATEPSRPADQAGTGWPERTPAEPAAAGTATRAARPVPAGEATPRTARVETDAPRRDRPAAASGGPRSGTAPGRGPAPTERPGPQAHPDTTAPAARRTAGERFVDPVEPTRSGSGLAAPGAPGSSSARPSKGGSLPPAPGAATGDAAPGPRSTRADALRISGDLVNGAAAARDRTGEDGTSGRGPGRRRAAAEPDGAGRAAAAGLDGPREATPDRERPATGRDRGTPARDRAAAERAAAERSPLPTRERTADRAGRPEPVDRPEQLDRPERAERPQRGERLDRPTRGERPERPERSGVMDRPERSGVMDRPAAAASLPGEELTDPVPAPRPARDTPPPLSRSSWPLVGESNRDVPAADQPAGPGSTEPTAFPAGGIAVPTTRLSPDDSRRDRVGGGSRDDGRSRREPAAPGAFPVASGLDAPDGPDLSRQGEGRVRPPWQADDLPAEPPALRLVEPAPLADPALSGPDPVSGPAVPSYEPPALRLVEPEQAQHSNARPRRASIERSTPPPVDAEVDDDLLIFADIHSAWFSGGEGDEPTGAPDWGHADDGWRAAEQAAQPQVEEETDSGLPRRVPQKNLVPGSPILAPERPLRIVRDAAAIAAHTTGYFRGWRRGSQEVGGYSVGGRPGRESAGGWDFSRDNGDAEPAESGYRSARR